MRLYVQQASFAAALDDVCKRISKNNVNPIYGGVLLRTVNDTLELTSTNSVRSIRHAIGAQVEEPGEIVLPGELLSKSVGRMADGTVTVETELGGTVVKCGRSRLRLNHMDANLFEEFPKVEPTSVMTVPRDLFASMVERATRYVQREQTGRPILLGVHVMAHDGVLEMSSTDSYRFFEATASVEAGDFDAIIDAESLRDMASMGMTDDVTMGVSENQVTMSCGDVSYVGRAISGTYPSFQPLLEQCHGIAHAIVDPHAMMSALSSIAIVAKDTGRVEVTPGSNSLTLRAASQESGEAVAEVDADVDGTVETIGLSHKYLFEGLRSMGDEVDMMMESSVKAVVMRSSDDCDMTYMLMPMRL